MKLNEITEFYRRKFDHTLITYVLIRLSYYFFAIFIFDELVGLADSKDFISEQDSSKYMTSYSSFIASIFFKQFNFFGYKIGSLLICIFFCINEILLVKKLKIKAQELILSLPISSYFIYTSSATKEYLIFITSFTLLHLLFDNLKNRKQSILSNFSILIVISIFLLIIRPIFTLPLILVVFFSFLKKKIKFKLSKFSLFIMSWLISYFCIYFLSDLFGLKDIFLQKINLTQLYDLADSKRIEHFLEFSQTFSFINMFIYLPKYLYISIFGIFPLEILKNPEYIIVFTSNLIINITSLKLNIKVTKNIHQYFLRLKNPSYIFNNVHSINLILSGCLISITSIFASYNIGFYFRANCLNIIYLIMIPLILNIVLKEKIYRTNSIN